MQNTPKRSVRACFFDIDGTLVSHTISDIPEGTLEALRDLQSRGILAFISTGRHISEFPILPLHDYPFDGYVTQSGQICYDRDFRTIVELPFPEEDTKALIRYFDSCLIPIVLFTEHSLFINYVDDVVRDTLNSIHTPIPEVKKYSGEKLFGASVYGPRETARQIAGEMPACDETRWHEKGSDIVLGSEGKVGGIRRILELYGIGADEIMAFGDADNDIDMLRFAGIGVAMGNGSEKAKEAADYVTSSVDQDGIRSALRHFGVI